jgi:hypothetical protein
MAKIGRPKGHLQDVAKKNIPATGHNRRHAEHDDYVEAAGKEIQKIILGNSIAVGSGQVDFVGRLRLGVRMARREP